jgi:hypothetical protein
MRVVGKVFIEVTEEIQGVGGSLMLRLRTAAQRHLRLRFPVETIVMPTERRV